MRFRLLSNVRVCVILALLSALALTQAPTGAAAPAAPDPSGLIFIENAGQFPGSARFQVRGGGLTLWLAEDAIWLTIFEQTSVGSPPSPGNDTNIKLSFPGANPHPRLEPFNRQETHVSFFTGSDPAKWRAGVPAWGGVRYVGLYSGIDLELTGERKEPVLRLVARRGADLDAVRLRVEGADAVQVHGGALSLSTAGRATYNLSLLRAEGSTTQAVVQPHGAMAFEVVAPFAAKDVGAPSPPTPDADKPAGLLYSTFLGGSTADVGDDVAVDASGAAYVTGLTASSDFPTVPGAFDTSFNGTVQWGGDAFVAKLNAAGSALEYATFLGGSGADEGIGIAVDGMGAAYVTGRTFSSDFPATPGAFDTSFNGGHQWPDGSDAFIVKLNPDGSAIDYATFLGGSADEWGSGIAVDANGAAYVMGATRSPDFPTTPGALDTSFNDLDDAFVVKLNVDGSALDYATFLGGTSSEVGYGVAVDGSGAATVAGHTISSDFPTTPGAYDTSPAAVQGFNDVFVVKLNAAGTAPIYATFVGGSKHDEVWDIAVDESGAAYVTGSTWSSDFPVTPDAFATSFNGGVESLYLSDAFVAKLNPAGSALDYATFMGGTGADHAYAIAVDGSGVAYISGSTESVDFPTTCGALDTTLEGSDAFVARLNAAGSALDYSTILGGSSSEHGNGIAVDGSGATYICGETGSFDWPTTPGAFDRSLGFDGSVWADAFVAKLATHPTPCANLYLPLVHRNW